MNDQKETLIRKSKWNEKRVVLLYWFAFIFLGTVAAAGLGVSILDPKNAINQVDHSSLNLPSEFAPEDCTGSMCHNNTVQSWNNTGHPKAGTLLPNDSWLVGDDHIYNQTEFSCMIECHTTRYNETDETYWTFGVSCAACHEEPGDIDHTTDNCGYCHTHEDSTEDHELSAHNDSMQDLLAGGYVADRCLHCMSGKGTYSADLSSTDPSISCATCHDPHDATNNHQLRESDVAELCGACHGSTVEVFASSGNKHGNLDCSSCHGYQEYSPYYAPTSTRVRVNHTWAINYEMACGQCHDDVASRESTLESIQGNFETLNASFFTQLINVTRKVNEANTTAGVDRYEVEDAYALIEEAEELHSLIEHDASNGFHNPTLADDKLKLALVKLDEAYTKAVDAMGGPSDTTGTTTSTSGTSGNGTPGFEFISVMAAISFIVTLTVLFQKKRR
ncbi:MAG: ammonia-forming cytochrome c nitrite reductase subunit c552 [Candidatus Hodarchaeales archaeon]|jgi:predicted CXXCH cytochrome family protein